MSSNKRRKLESQDAPQSALSAMSAISARRRLGGGGETSSSNSTPSNPEPKKSTSSSNAFSVLQSLSRQGDSPSLSTSQVAKAPPISAKTARSSVPKKGEERKNDGSSVESSAEVATSRAVQFSSFRPTKRSCRIRSDGVTELRLEESERFLVLGSFGVRIIEGEVTAAGASLRADGEIHWVHAPHCHAIPVLRTREHTRLELHVDSDAYALRQLGRLSPLFRRMWNEPEEQGAISPHSASTFQILCSSDDAPKKCIIQDLVSPPEWNKKLSSLEGLGADGDTFTILVCGPKSSGKSTFSKILTNRLVTRRVKNSGSNDSGVAHGIVVLDLDPGQPEYAIPGTLSLVHVARPNLSPPFAHASLESPDFRVVRCHSLASVSPASDPDCYRECVVNLYDEYRKTLSNMPLIINTPGWILGTGLEILDDIINHTSPNEVVYMSEEGPTEAVDVLRAVATTKAFSTLPSQPTEYTARTGAHLRAMQTMSYLHSKAVLNGTHSAVRRGHKWDASPLTAIVPWRVLYTGTNSGIVGILSYDYQSPSELLADTINGTVLAVVEIENPKAYRGLLEQGSATPRVSRTPEGIPFIRNSEDSTLDPKYSQTIGLVLVRGIDVPNQSLQLITPIPSEKMQKIMGLGRQIVLVHGKFDAPNWAYTEDLYQRSDDGDARMGMLEVEDQDTSEDESDMEPDNVDDASDMTAVPWVEVLKGHEKRPVGSKVWRVRRDLGRNAGDR